jgi:hypothetical protein
MAISRASMGKQIRNGPAKKNHKRAILSLPKGVKARPKMMTKVMRQSKRGA